MHPDVVVSRRGAERLRNGHPWIYRSDVVSSGAAPGDLVRVMSERKRPLAWAWWSSASQIALRVLDSVERSPEFVEDVVIQARIQTAIDYRTSLAIDATACRLVHAEADRVPGFIVDQYRDQSADRHGDADATWLVVQTLAQGTDRRSAQLVGWLVEMLRPRGVLARNDPKVRTLEGLEPRVDVLHGDVPDLVTVREGQTSFRVDLRHGQKTGLFLDQRENHAAAARYARGRALDGFSYHGGFALAMARHADHVVALESSAAAAQTIRANAAENGLANVEVREVNVFDELREYEIARARFDTIVLDPPAFAKNRASVDRAAAGYKEINLRAMKLLAPGGHLITCSCSHHIDEAIFDAILQSAAADAHAPMALIERRQQSADHPVLLGVPESGYLKCLVLRRMA